jgi:uncharacterized protein YndB with AHSA1/START domain
VTQSDQCRPEANGPAMHHSISVSRDIDAPAHAIFALLASPETHSAIDGSGMLQNSMDPEAISAVGDVFYMQMSNERMGSYVMANRVVEFEHDRLIAWEPVLYSIENEELQSEVNRSPNLHRWGWQLQPLDSGRTRVTEFFDCSRSSKEFQEKVRDGERWRQPMEASLEKLESLLRPI